MIFVDRSEEEEEEGEEEEDEEVDGREREVKVGSIECLRLGWHMPVRPAGLSSSTL